MPYADAVSHELWLLVRPASVGSSETSQFYTGRRKHPTEDKVYIGPINGPQPIHGDADEFALAAKIGAAITEEEAAFIVQSIADAKGGSLSILEMVEQIDSLSPNLRTREQLEAEGWLPTDEV